MVQWVNKHAGMLAVIVGATHAIIHVSVGQSSSLAMAGVTQAGIGVVVATYVGYVLMN